MSDIENIKAELTEARASLDELKADRKTYALAAAKGDDKAQAALDDLSERQLGCEQAISDLELATAAAETEAAEHAQEIAERKADGDFTEAKKVADEMRADAKRADELLAELAGLLARRGGNIDRLRRLQALDSPLANRLGGPLVLQRVLAHWLRDALGRESLGVHNAHRQTLSEIDGGILKMIRRPAVTAKAA